MSGFQMMCALLSSMLFGVIIGTLYSAYITLAIYEEDFSLWDVIVMALDVITGRIRK